MRLSRCESQLLSKWSICFVCSSYHVTKIDACLSLTNGRVSRVSPPITGFLKVRGFRKKKQKKQEGLINLLLQRSGNIWKCCSSSLSPSNEFTYNYLKYVAETNLFVTDEHDSQDLRQQWFDKHGLTSTVFLLSFYLGCDFCTTWHDVIVTGKR